jgi:hypothetical protein
LALGVFAEALLSALILHEFESLLAIHTMRMMERVFPVDRA